MWLFRLLLAAVLAGLALPAAAATDDGAVGVRIERLLVDPDGTTRLGLSISGLSPDEDIKLENLMITENGEPVSGVELVGEEHTDIGAIVPGVVVAIDVSGSTQGEALEGAKAAAAELFQGLAGEGASVGLVSFGPEVRVVSGLSTDITAALQAAQQLTAEGATALYDGVARSVRLLSTHEGPRDVVVFSDGNDTVSTTTLDGVRALLADAGVRVTTVALRSEELDLAPLAAIAEASGGDLVEVVDPDQLTAAFETVEASLRSRVEVVWQAEPVSAPPAELQIVATYQAGVGAASAAVATANPRTPDLGTPQSVIPPSPPVPVLTGSIGLLVAVGALALSVALLVLLALGVGGSRRRQARLKRRLATYEGADPRREQAVSEFGSLTHRAATAMERVPRPGNFDARIAAKIEQADWPLRVGEFLLIVAGAAVAGGLVLGVMAGSAPMAFFGLLLGAAAPGGWLLLSVSRRQSAFSDQLPDVLQVLAGALRAGHGFNTALEGAVAEVDDPARTELRRASVEARLGRPMEEALLDVATRMDSQDLYWVVSALAVQRQVGGNLAEVLSNVAKTLRDRASVRRQVAALSAEGKLSGIVVGGMPFVMMIVMGILNPGYMSLLFERTLGRLMLAGASVLLVIGVLWLRRVIQPKY